MYDDDLTLRGCVYTKCIQCNEKDCDFKLRAFRDTRTGEFINGHRMFCSDDCENTYVADMEKIYGKCAFELLESPSR